MGRTPGIFDLISVESLFKSALYFVFSLQEKSLSLSVQRNDILFSTPTPGGVGVLRRRAVIYLRLVYAVSPVFLLVVTATWPAEFYKRLP